MKDDIVLACEFVEYIPEKLKERTLYVSEKYGTAVHRCCCGCGREVVTPLSPTDWQLRVDGTSVSLYPSIGSWSLPCQSHYWIWNNKVVWAPKWSKEQVAMGRAYEASAKERYYGNSTTPAAAHEGGAMDREPAETKPAKSIWQKLKKWLFG